MKRVRMITLGFLLMFVGAQLVAVQNFWLTPRASLFLEQQSDDKQNNMDTFSNDRQPQLVSASYSAGGNVLNPKRMTQTTTITQKNFAPPPWLKWASLFAGAVLILHGLAAPK